jgi:hypothetical protein
MNTVQEEKQISALATSRLVGRENLDTAIDRGIALWRTIQNAENAEHAARQDVRNMMADVSLRTEWSLQWIVDRALKAEAQLEEQNTLQIDYVASCEKNSHLYDELHEMRKALFNLMQCVGKDAAYAQSPEYVAACELFKAK